LIAGAGASAAASARLRAQLAAWDEAGAADSTAFDADRRRVFQLLAGDVDAVVPSLDLDWRRALGCHLWYGAGAAGAAVADALAAYAAAAAAGAAPRPAPMYAEGRGAGASGAEAGGAVDVCFELLRLAPVALPPGADVDADGEVAGGEEAAELGDGWSAPGAGAGAGAAAAARRALLARALRPAAASPDPLDHSFGWHALATLRALGAVADTDGEAPGRGAAGAAAAAAAGFAEQLAAAGGLAHWAVFAALHVPDAARREAAARRVLAAHAPEWAGDAAVEGFLKEALRVPEAWLADARASWAAARGDDAARVRELLAAGVPAEAHAALLAAAAPRWLLAARRGDGGARAALAAALGALEAARGAVDAGAGPGAWERGGGVYAAYLFLSGVYAALAGDASAADADAPALDRAERLAAAAAIARRLDDLAAAGAAAAAAPGAAADAPAAARLRAAAGAAMAEDLARWVLGDVGAEAPGGAGAERAALVARLRALPTGAALEAVQAGAVALAAQIA
jgi:hypothetical protein